MRCTPRRASSRMSGRIGGGSSVQRSLLQSFDWRTLVESKKELPGLKTVALAQASTIFPGTPWTAGVPIAADAWSGGTLARLAWLIMRHRRIVASAWIALTVFGVFATALR